MNKYFKLKPPSITDKSSLCSCNDNFILKIMSTLGYNPVYCMICNLEVEPEKLQLNDLLIEMIVNWRDFYNSIYHLWLNSSCYETLSFNELSNINSELNNIGLSLNKEMNNYYLCYYWYFHNSLLEDINKCPVCNYDLKPFNRQKICPNSHIVIG